MTVGCEGIRELAQARLEGALSPQERERLERHLHACPACRHVVVEYERLFALLPMPPAQPLPHGFAARTLARVAAAQRRRRAWQAVAVAASIAVVLGIAALATGFTLPAELAVVADAAGFLDSWGTVLISVGDLVTGLIAAGGGWLLRVPGGPMALAALAAAIGLELLMVYRWRVLAKSGVGN